MLHRSSERKLAAILEADVAGYSRLMGHDEEGTLARLKLYRDAIFCPKIKQHHGRLVKTTGDGLLVEFASPVEAVRCAVEIQQAVADQNADLSDEHRLEFRIGVNLGDVIAEADDIYGDGVNVTARLEALAEPGGICLSRTVRDQVRDRLPYLFEDIGEQSVKNIARPVRAFRMRAETISALPPPTPASPTRSRAIGMALAGSAAAALILLAGVGWWVWPLTPVHTDQAGIAANTAAVRMMGVSGSGAGDWSAPRLSLVVLPFANVGDDPAQEYFAEAITDDLTTDLSRIPDSFVISHASAASYRGKALDIRQVGRELNVRYALTGSVRRSGEQVRINAQLVDVASGQEIWADRFAGDWSQLEHLQDDVTARLANALGVQLVQVESQRAIRDRPKNPDAIDLAMRGWAALNRPRSPEHIREALSLFDRAVQLAPQLTSALIGKARSLTYLVWLRWSASPEPDLAEADRIVSKVMAEQPDNAMARFIKGDILKAQGKFEQAIPEFETAIAADRNLALAYEALGHTKILLGRSEEAFDFLNAAIRLSPRDPALNFWLFHVCHAHTHLGHDAEAIPWCQKSIAAGPLWLAYVDLAASYAWLGQEAEAQAAVAELLKLMPGYTVQKWATAGWSNNPKFLIEYQRIVEGLRRAGLPE